MQNFLNSIRKFRSDTRGNTAMMLALCILPIGVMAGAAIDFNRHQSNSLTLGTNLDSATLAAARFVMDNPLADQAAVEDFAANYLTSAFEPTATKTLDNVNINYIPNRSVTISAESTIETTMLGLAQIESLTTKKLATASISSPTALRAVLVLDNSDSMDGEKMEALEMAANEFVDQLAEDDNGTGGGVDRKNYIGIVPFSHYVSVDLSNEGEFWLDVPAREVEMKTTCPVDADASDDLGCFQETTSCTRVDDGVEYTDTCTNWVCPENVELVENCSEYESDNEWCGAVIQRAPPLHLVDGDYDSDPIDGYNSTSDWECNTPILPMTHAKGVIQNYLSDLDAKGDTYIAPGLMWGYRVLTPEAPFTEMEGKFEGAQAMVLMSDGTNSRSFRQLGSGPDHYGSDKDDANQTTLDTCDFIKSRDIDIYTIAFQVDDAETEEMLRDCATSPEHNFDAGSFDELTVAFSSVANAFREVALTE